MLAAINVLDGRNLLTTLNTPSVTSHPVSRTLCYQYSNLKGGHETQTTPILRVNFSTSTCYVYQLTKYEPCIVYRRRVILR